MLSFEGRSNRLAFLGLTLIGLVLMVAGFGVAALVDLYVWRGTEANRAYLGLVTVGLLIPGFWLSLAVSVRRCHDMGWSGWWVLIRIIPLAALIQFFWILFAPGEDHDNRFGPPPTPS